MGEQFCHFCKKAAEHRYFSRQEQVDEIDRTMVGLLTFGISEAVFACTRTAYKECQNCGATTIR